MYIINNEKVELDEDKELATLLTGYQDMVGLLNIHKVARLNTQVLNYLFCRKCIRLMLYDCSLDLRFYKI